MQMNGRETEMESEMEWKKEHWSWGGIELNIAEEPETNCISISLAENTKKNFSFST